MSASNRNFPPAGNAEGIYTFSHPGFSYVAVLPNRAYGAFTPANDPRPSVRRDQHPVAVAEAANPASMTAPTVVAAAGALIGSVAFRVLMWLASVTLMSLFGATI